MDRWTNVADSLDALVVSESICSLGMGLGLITPSWVPPTVVTHLLHCHGHLPKPFGEGQAALPRPALALAIESERLKITLKSLRCHPSSCNISLLAFRACP